MCILKTQLKLNPKTKEYLKNLPKLYLVVRYAKWSVLEVPFSGRIAKDGKPLVYVYDDFNGEEKPAYYLRSTKYATGGYVLTWCLEYETAQTVADMLNDPESDLFKTYTKLGVI